MPQVLRMMNGHFLRRGVHRRHHQIALVLAVVVVGHDHDLAAPEGFDGGGHALLGVGHETIDPLLRRHEADEVVRRHRHRRSPWRCVRARSNEGISPSQICVTRPGEISAARAKSARVDFDCFSQSASCINTL
jgi:hypothetical protein